MLQYNSKKKKINICEQNIIELLIYRFSNGNKSWSILEALLRCGDGLAVKLKDGRYPYGAAPSGLQVKLAHLLTQDDSARWTIKAS